MANVLHSVLTGTDLHEPKAIAAAPANTVYMANGSGSGSWTAGSVLLGITGQIADFATPVAPTGWLECDGSAISRTTFSTLYNALAIQQTCATTNNSPTITGLPSTANMFIWTFVSGTGIPLGATVLSVDSGTQIHINVNATATGTPTISVSPWPLGDGSTTFNIPNTRTTGYYRRSRQSTLAMGVT